MNPMWCLVLAMPLSAFAAAAQDAALDAERIADELAVLAKAVLGHHVEPPVRQQLMLAAVRSVYDAAGQALSVDAAGRFSDVTGDQSQALAAQMLASLPENLDPALLKSAAIQGLLHAVPGGARVLDPEALELERGSDRFLSNTYVGIGIALRYEEKRQESVIDTVFESGPGYAAGAKPGDVIRMIDGRDASKLDLKELIKLLRGPEDSTLTLVVQQPDEPEPRTLHIVRRIVPRSLVDGYHVLEGGFACLRIHQVAASTVHELRKLENRARHDACRGVVLDLRGCGQSDVHYAVTLADALLSPGKIGSLRRNSGTTDYWAEPDSLFHDWPTAVLLDGKTSDHAWWVAAALRANGRSRVLGLDAGRPGYVYEPVPLPDSDLAIVMATGRLIAPPVAASGQTTMTADEVEETDSARPRGESQEDALVAHAVKLLEKELQGKSQ
jgi:carboxyl-terminal processing protease